MIITSKYALNLSRRDTRCTFCGRSLTYPFLEWHHNGGNLCLCGDCCRDIRTPFGRDMAEITTIIEMQKIGYRFGFEEKDRADLVALGMPPEEIADTSPREGRE